MGKAENNFYNIKMHKNKNEIETTKMKKEKIRSKLDHVHSLWINQNFSVK